MFTSWSMADILRWHHHFICRKKSRLGRRVSSLKFIKSVLVLKHVSKTVLIAYFFFSRLKIKSRYISIFFTKVLDIKIPSKLKKTNFASLKLKTIQPNWNSYLKFFKFEFNHRVQVERAYVSSFNCWTWNTDLDGKRCQIL